MKMALECMKWRRLFCAQSTSIASMALSLVTFVFFFSSLREKQELNWTNTRVTEWGVFWVSGFSILYLVWFKLGAARVHLSFLKFGHVTWHRSMRCVLRNDAPLVSLSTVESAGWTDNGGWRNSISRFLIINENKKKRKKWINNKPGPQTTTSERRVSQG